MNTIRTLDATEVKVLGKTQNTDLHAWPPSIDLHALSQKEPHPPSFILPDWLPCGYATLFAGHGGVGKSALALMLAVCISMGLPFMGINVERRRVLYLSCEDREGLLHWRLTRICTYLGISLSDLAEWLDIIDLVGHETILYQPGRDGLTLTGAYRQLAAMIRVGLVQVLMVDGISDTYDGNENARAEVKAFVNALLALIPPDDGAVVLVGHVSKPAAGSKYSEGYSGSTGWHNSVRARWYLYPETMVGDDGRPERTGNLCMELQKSNLGPADKAVKFSWNPAAGLFVPKEVAAESLYDRVHRQNIERNAIMSAFLACKACSIVCQ